LLPRLDPETFILTQTLNSTLQFTLFQELFLSDKEGEMRIAHDETFILSNIEIILILPIPLIDIEDTINMPNKYDKLFESSTYPPVYPS
jgi:hypothetical protein